MARELHGLTASDAHANMTGTRAASTCGQDHHQEDLQGGRAENGRNATVSGETTTQGVDGK